ncbi:putative serine/threonine-protein kinase roco4 [Stylophora pistillata]|uniref:Putative serine/threonine-protein kinase roco4 n=1 Tax=Stylophora pistillata TaxID=50429 RepID=A0A2B4R2U4_STYPI|nr:putative serine/threonine-protein kinase roco4 [Stylophora pistillata]
MVPLEIQARGPEAVEAYDKALTEGKACIKRIPIMLIGQERTGKTSLKRSLKGEKFDKEEKSTDGIETDPSYFKVSTETWKSGQTGEEMQTELEVPFENLAAAKVIFDRLKKGESFLSAAEAELDSESSTESSTESDSESSTESSTESDSESSTKSAREVFRKTHRETTSSQRKLPEELAKLVEKLLREGESASEDQIYSILWDFGGQTVYYDTHPIFLTEKAIYILVSDLSRDPNERANLPVKTGLFKTKVDTNCIKTNLDYLDFWMSSIYSLRGLEENSSQQTAPPVSDVLPGRLPPVFLVCTHADAPVGGSKARDLALEVYGFLQSKIYRENLYKDVFVVDNTKSGSVEECIGVKRLREELLAVAKELQLTKEEIPVKWLRYENNLRKKCDKWITLDEAKRIAFEECGIQEDNDFSTLMNFLHDQRIVIHFSGSPELEKMVILDPQWLVDVLKSVITVRRFKQAEHPVKDLWIQLEETGIIDERLIDHAWGDLLGNQESHKSLIAIMERLSLLSAWPSWQDRKQYLVPSMLKSPPTDEVLKLLHSVNIPSLFIKFASGRVPPGLFSRLILLFFQWCGEEWNNEMNPQLFYNFVIFCILPDQGISVIFWCHSSAIEVAVYSGGNEKTSADICRVVHWKLRFILECMRREFHWLNNMKYDMCVCCPVCSQPGSVKCHDHDVRGCECLHFLSESDLRKRQHCNKPGRSLLGDYRIRIQQFQCWFSFGQEKERAGMSTNQMQTLHATHHGGPLGEKGIFSMERAKRKELALPESVKNSIQSIPLDSASNVKDIVIQFQRALQLEPASLTSAEPEAKNMIRGLTLRAKSEKRDDLVRHLREITPAGTTGPLLNEDMSVGNMPFKQYKDLTFSLSGGEEWKLLAERLGLSQIEIRFLDKRVVNPSDVVLRAVGEHRHLSVGEIYDTLVDCELPVFADLM